jgi:hypothetical protein
MPALGTAVLVSFIPAQLFFEDYVNTVWCFFAAVLSLLILGMILKGNRQPSIETCANIGT